VPSLHDSDWLWRREPMNATIDMKAQPQSSTQEVLAGLVERVTYHNAENGFCVLRAQPGLHEFHPPRQHTNHHADISVQVWVWQWVGLGSIGALHSDIWTSRLVASC
jgi:hypothetical protein